MYEGSSFSTSRQNSPLSFDYSHSSGFVVVSHRGFNLHFRNGGEHLFTCLLATWMSSLVKHIIKSLSHFLTRLFVLLLLSCEFFLLRFYFHFDQKLFQSFSIIKRCIMVQHTMCLRECYLCSWKTMCVVGYSVQQTSTKQNCVMVLFKPSMFFLISDCSINYRESCPQVSM